MNRTIPAALAYAGAIFALGMVLGTLRVLVLAPRLGELAAVALELPVMLAVSWVVSGALLRRWPGVSPIPMGALAFVLLMLAEFALGVVAFGLAPADWIAVFATLPGAMGLAGQVAFGLIPGMRGRR